MLCLNCGRELPAEYAQGAAIEPCPACGHVAELEVALTERRGVGDDGRASVAVSNDAVSRLAALDRSIAGLERALAAADARGAHNAVKAALEALHELGDDSLKRGEWSKDDWSAEDRELMAGLAGARNAAHHKSAAVVALEFGTDRVRDLRWVAHLPPIRSQEQTKAYCRRLAGQRVVAVLLHISARIAASL
jgi:hypothetical protein